MRGWGWDRGSVALIGGEKLLGQGMGKAVVQQTGKIAQWECCIHGALWGLGGEENVYLGAC